MAAPIHLVPVTLADHVGQFLRATRLSRSHTQISLAAELHISQATLSEWERGTCCPRINDWMAICLALACEPGHSLQTVILAYAHAEAAREYAKNAPLLAHADRRR